MLRYIAFFIIFVGMLIFNIINYQIGTKALAIAANSFKEVFIVVSPIFIILGLLVVWIPWDIVVK